MFKSVRALFFQGDFEGILRTGVPILVLVTSFRGVMFGALFFGFEGCLGLGLLDVFGFRSWGFLDLSLFMLSGF